MWFFDVVIIICLLSVIGNLYEIKVLLKKKPEKGKVTYPNFKKFQ